MPSRLKLRPSLLLATFALWSACSAEKGQGVEGSLTTTTTDPATGASPSSTPAGQSSSANGATTAGASSSTMASGPSPTTAGASSATSGNTGHVVTETNGPDAQTSDGTVPVEPGETSNPERTSEALTSTDASDDSGAVPSSPLPPTEDYSDFGPFETTSQANTGPDGTYTIVRPETLGADGFLHAPITFGPGTGMQVAQMMGLLERIASHGFVIVGRQLEGGPRDPVTRARMIAGLDWIIEQNSTAGSVFEGKLDVEHAVAMGYSVGGTGAVEIGGHEAIATVVSIHGHGAKGELRGPLLLMGGTEDVMDDGNSWLTPTYEDSQTQTFFSLVVGADHGYIQGTYDGVPGGVETPAMIAWLRYWIYDDQAAKRYFEGDDCVMCTAPWSNPQRKNWP